MKKAAKFASKMPITGFVYFQPTLGSIKHDFRNFTDALASNKSFINKNQCIKLFR